MRNVKQDQDTEDQAISRKLAAEQDLLERQQRGVPSEEWGDTWDLGLRSQGEVGRIAPDGLARRLKALGRRAAPTRHDAMEIAGHERLAGYGPQAPSHETPALGRPGRIALFEKEPVLQSFHAPRSLSTSSLDKPKNREPTAPRSVVAAAREAQEAALDEAMEMQHSSDDAVLDEAEDVAEDAREAADLQAPDEQRQRDAKTLEGPDPDENDG